MKETNIIRRAYTLGAFCAAFGVGRTYVYKLIAEGQLHVRKAGKRTLIPADEAMRWFQSLPIEGGHLSREDGAMTGGSSSEDGGC